MSRWIRKCTLQHTSIHCNTQYKLATHVPRAFRRRRRWISKWIRKYAVQHTAPNCNTLQKLATHCKNLQHTAKNCNARTQSTQKTKGVDKQLDIQIHSSTQCTKLQHTANMCNTLQKLATHVPKAFRIRRRWMSRCHCCAPRNALRIHV